MARGRERRRRKGNLALTLTDSEPEATVGTRGDRWWHLGFGTLLLVGQGKLPAAEVGAVLASRERARAGANVPPDGLYFSGAEYGVRRVEGRPAARLDLS